MKRTIKIYKGKPTDYDWEEINRMIADGYTSGIDRPYGINWELI